jgi:prepilin-type N-terminal cleavage/methylation domain-containing protein
MRARPGVTLLEVLIAIFIMGIGLLALLALFPLGAATMTQAMRDARLAEAGHNGKGVCFSQNIMHDGNVNPLYLSGAPGSPPLLPDWNGPSYPVYVDPIGVWYITGMSNQIAPNFPRIASSQTTNSASALRWCSLHDDYTFDNSGSAINAATGGVVERESRYTWAYLMKLPNVQTPSVVDINLVVYQGRNLQVPGGETPYQVVSVPNPKTIVVAYNNGNKPNIKRGGWILDVTSYNPNDPALRPLALKYGPVAGTFYRVVDITDVNVGGVGPALEVELQSSQNISQNVVVPIKNILVLDNVAEVFSIGTGWKAGVVGGAPGLVQ